MHNPLIRAWEEASWLERFVFLYELDRRYNDSQRGGLVIMRMSMLRKVKEIEDAKSDTRTDGRVSVYEGRKGR